MAERGRDLPLFDAAPSTPLPGAVEPTLPLDQAAPPRPSSAPLPPGVLPAAPSGYGRIVRAAWPVLSVLARLRSGAQADDPDALKLACIRAIKRFDEEAGIAGTGPAAIADARYAICTAVDEAVLGSAWGDRSDWAQDSLLATFHNETWGGEKVFAIVDRLIAEPARDPELAELVYLLLSFGFQGKYHLRRNGSMEIEDLRERLFAGLRRRVGEVPPMPQPLLRTPGRRNLARVIPVWVVGVVCLVAACGTFLVFREALVVLSEGMVPHYDMLWPGGV